MEIAEKITLITSIFWVIWSMLSLRNAVVEAIPTPGKRVEDCYLSRGLLEETEFKH